MTEKCFVLHSRLLSEKLRTDTGWVILQEISRCPQCVIGITVGSGLWPGSASDRWDRMQIRNSRRAAGMRSKAGAIATVAAGVHTTSMARIVMAANDRQLNDRHDGKQNLAHSRFPLRYFLGPSGITACASREHP